MGMGSGRHKILYMVSTLRKCGPTNQLFGLIKNLDRELFEPHLLTLSREPELSRYTDFLRLGVAMASLKMSRKELLIKGRRAIKEAVGRIKPDLIHSSGIRPDRAAAKYLRVIPQVSTVRNYAFDDYPVKFGFLAGTILAYQHIRVLKRVQYPVSCSRAIQKTLEEKEGLETLVVQNGVDADQFTPVSAEEKSALREELKLSPDKRLFISSGSLIDRKDPLTVIRAFDRADISAQAELVFLGDGPLLESCREAAGAAVSFVGYTERVLDYLRAADVFVSASKSEGLPNSVLEAMGTALPLILSDIPPHKEIMDKNKGMGLLFAVEDAAQLSAAFREVLKKDLSVMGRLAAGVMKSSFSARVMSRSYQELYREILQDQHKGNKEYQ